MSFTLPCILWSQRILHFQQTIIAKITEMYDQINSIVGEGQWGLACCNSWGCKESNTTEWLNWTELRQHIKKQKHYFTDKGPSNQSYGFSNSHVWIWELHHVRALKNWCFWAVVLEKILESPLDYREVKPANPKEINPEYSSEGLILKLKLQYFGHLIYRADSGKDPDAGKDWRQEEKGMTEDEIVEWHHWLNGHEFEQALAAGDGQASLACFNPWGCKESATTEQLNWTEVNQKVGKRPKQTFLQGRHMDG